MISGLRTLSIVETANVPQSRTKIPQPVCPSLMSHSPAGTHTSGGPTGTGDTTNVSRPSSGAAAIPAIQKPIAATTPCTSAVPRMPSTTPRTVVVATDARCVPRSPAMRCAAARSRSTIAWPSRNMNQAMKIDSESCSTAPATEAPDATANLRNGSTYSRSKPRSCAVSCAMLFQ